jgi:hypothetical protein
MEFHWGLFGQVIAVWIIIATVLTYFLAKRKTQTPVIATILGFFLSFMPPLSMIYLIVLVLKNDISNTQEPAQRSD